MNDGFKRFTVKPQEIVTYTFIVGSGKEFISAVTGWPGSDVSLTLISPSGTRFDRETLGSDVTRITGETYEHVEISDPETGTWTAELNGLDVPAAGEPVTLSIYQADPLNAAPTARITVEVTGDHVVLDGSESTDSDGEILGYDWYITSADDDLVLQGESITVPLDRAMERTYTLVVTDDDSATGFQDLAWVPIDVIPGSETNPVKIAARGTTPIAILSTPTLDAMSIPPTSLSVGPEGASVAETVARGEDVNGDGLIDQVIHVQTRSLGLGMADSQLCVTGNLPNERSFSSCDTIRVQ